jgi:intracellular protein transport protein USO1
MIQDHQRQLEHVQKTAEANTDRTRKRMEAEMADLQSHIGKLAADLAKVNKLKRVFFLLVYHC